MQHYFLHCRLEATTQVTWEKRLRQVDIFLFLQCTYIYISPYVVSKKDPFEIVFCVRIFHQRHENWLHMLIARIFLHRLSLSKFLDILETFSVTYQQETIVKSSQLLQNMGLNTHRIHLPSVSVCPGCNQLRRGFLKNDTIASGECDRKRYTFYFRDYLHIEKPKCHGLLRQTFYLWKMF